MTWKPLVCRFLRLTQPLVCGHFLLRDADYTGVSDPLQFLFSDELITLVFQGVNVDQQLHFGIVVAGNRRDDGLGSAAGGWCLYYRSRKTFLI